EPLNNGDVHAISVSIHAFFVGLNLVNYKKIIQFSVGPIANALLGLATLPIITWFFSQEDVGKISMLQVVTSFTTMIFCLGLDQSYVREYHDYSNKAKLFRTVWLPSSLVLLIFIVIAGIITKNNIVVWLFEVDSVVLTISISIMLFTTLSARFFSLTLRMKERGLAYSSCQIVPKIVVLIIISIIIMSGMEKSFENLLYANVIGSLALFSILIWYSKDTLKHVLLESVNYLKLKSMLSYGLPLTFGAIAYWGLTAADKMMLRSLSTYEELGLYSVSISFASAATIFHAVFSTIWAPTVYKWVANKENLDKIAEVRNYVMLAVVVLFCIAGMFSWIVPFLLPEVYKDVQWILVACMGAPLLYMLSETTVVGIGISRKSIYSMLASILAFLVNIVGNYLLVPDLGARGAAISTCISFYVLFVLRTEFASRAWLPIKRSKLYFVMLVVVSSSVMMALSKSFTTNFIVTYWTMLFAIMLFSFRMEVKTIYTWMLDEYLRRKYKIKKYKL
ncbi:lipopolysaccharide biosynthesis protein, partial [Vibrio furnissii]|uniref:lipopolysaccharide biosynthesis protein n=1 Tax=Vibrio furnissii TaxID=29494 RepID=UPI001EEB1A29|nr:oligosaccharide flippase family protein [Vibrio furnissii]